MSLSPSENQLLEAARNGDINAFQELFATFQHALRSYLYRLLAHRADAEDLTHDTFIRAYDKLHLFRAESSLKTWVFRIGTRLAHTHLAQRKRWTEDVSEQAKALVRQNPSLAQRIVQTAEMSPEGRYEIREHIDTCFTCISKNLPVENQIALILKDIYSFSIREIEVILEKSNGTVKYLLQSGRTTMTDIFGRRCALINKEGICHQCSELNGWLNPRQDQQEARMKIDWGRGSAKYNRDELYQLRAKLVAGVDPLRSEGNALQEVLMGCNRRAMGEKSID